MGKRTCASSRRWSSHFFHCYTRSPNAQNYHEVVVSAVGTVRMRTVLNGVAVDDVTSVDTHIPRNTWFQVELRRDSGTSLLKINGSVVFNIQQLAFTSGQVGLVTHAAVGHFDNVFVGLPFGDQGFLETFSGPSFVTFTQQSGQWSILNGTYRNSAVQQTSVTLAPIHTGVNVPSGDTIEYTFRARMLNPYAASGNRVGIVFNYEGTQYSEVVFSPTGVASVNLVRNGITTTLATASYGGSRNVAFNVTLENSPNFVSVLVDGVRLFANVPGANPNLYPQGGVGLITHWVPGRFDNVQFDHGIFRPCSLTFDDPLPPFWIVRGAWNTDGGTLNSTAVGQSDSVDLPCFGNGAADDVGTGAVYSARLRNEYGNSGNLVGLIYNSRTASTLLNDGDYYEVVFSTTGIMQLNKFIEGVRYPVRTLTHNIPRNTWFNVQVIRSGIFTDVKLNGVTVVSQLPQGELRGGEFDVITHWTKGHFDNVSLTDLDVRLPSEL